MAIQSIFDKAIKKTTDVVDYVKTSVVDHAEKVHDLKKKQYHVTVIVDKKGVTHTLSTNRNTKHTIKWRAKSR